MKDYTDLNKTRGDVLKHILLAAFGLAVFGAGVYLTIQANIGVAPWDVLNQGIAKRTGMLYGNVLITIAVAVLIVDVLLKEPIGIGMLLDAVIVGKTVDLLNWLDPVPLRHSLTLGIVCLALGIIVMAAGMRVYMAAGLGCGPRDTLLVALCKRFPKLSIGALNILMWAAVCLIGWLLGGQVGIGTLISVLGMGPALQAVCRLTGFDAAKVKHQNLLESLQVLRGR